MVMIKIRIILNRIIEKLKFLKGELHYVGGSEALPPPLKKIMFTDASSIPKKAVTLVWVSCGHSVSYKESLCLFFQL